MTNTTPGPNGQSPQVYQNNRNSAGIDPNTQTPADILNNPMNLLSGLTNPGGPFAFLAALSRPDFWVRAGIIVLGIGLVIVGIIVLVSSSKTVGAALTAAGQAAKLTPAGAAASVVTEAA